MRKVLLRVEAGPDIGLGHLRRSISLTQAMESYGVDGHFLLHPDSQALAFAERAGRSGKLLKESNPFGEEDVRETLSAAERFGTDQVLVDYDRIPVAYVEKLRAAGMKVLVRDDLALWALPAHVVINGNADAERLDYRPWGKQPRFFLGPRYAVLPRECWKPARRITRPEVARVLVVMGGSDSGGCMPRLLERLDRMPGDFEVTAILGPFSKNAEQIREITGRLQRRIRWVVSPESLAPFIAEADLAVSAAGQTLYELACFGCPSVSFQVAANQQGQLEALAEAGCVRDAGESGDVHLLDRVEETLLGLLQNFADREAMARAGQELIDGQGADRVARGIWKETE